MGAPVTTVASGPVAPSGAGTVTVDVDTWPMMVRARVRATVLTVPAGRWLAQLTVSGRHGQPPLHVEIDQTLGAPGTVTIPAQTFRVFRPLTSAGSLTATVRVLRRSGSSWVRYGGSRPLSITVDQAPARRAGNEFGVHLLPYKIPSDVDAAGKQTAALDAAQADGAHWVRWSFQWSLMQPNAASTWDTVQAAKTDALMTACAARGLKVLGIVGAPSCPAWADTGNGPDPTKLATYVGEFLTRWPGVSALEVANEPELNAVSAARYVNGHNGLWAAVKAHTSTVPVIFGAFGGAALSYIGSCLDVGLTGFDAISIHPYNIRFPGDGTEQWGAPDEPWNLPDEGVPGIVQAVYAVDEFLRGRGFDKPVWVTEFGYASDCLRAPNKGSSTPRLAADRLAYSLRQAARMAEIPVTVVHCAQDPTPSRSAVWLEGFGLRSNAGAVKLSGVAFHDTLAGLAAGTL